MTVMECANVRRLIGEGLNIERNSPTCVSVRAHLSSCAECKKFMESLHKTIDCYKSYEVPKPDNLDTLLKGTIDRITGTD